MALIDGYYRIRIDWDQDYTLHRLTLEEAIKIECIISDLVSKDYVMAFNDIPFCCLDGEKDYSIEFRGEDDKLILLRFYIWCQIEDDIGIIECSSDTDDCFLFKTNSERTFEIYVFKGMKHKEDDLYGMLVDGHLDSEINELLKTRPF